MRRLLLVSPHSCVSDLEPLLSAYARQRILVTHHAYDSVVPAEDCLRQLANGHNAALLIGSRSRAPRTVLSGPTLTTIDGRKIPVGWIPMTSSRSLRRFAQCAAELHQRDQKTPSLALLAQRHPRFLRLASRIQTILHDRPVFRWTAADLVPESMLDGLSSGIGAAIYLGHGRPAGWAGYYGLREHHFTDFRGSPTGAIFSLCCNTASRRNIGLSFAEALPLRGVCGAVFAAVEDTWHTDNTRWAVRLSTAMMSGAQNLGEAICAALPPSSRAFSAYRILGDPLAPIRAPLAGSQRAASIEVFA